MVWMKFLLEEYKESRKGEGIGRRVRGWQVNTIAVSLESE